MTCELWGFTLSHGNNRLPSTAVLDCHFGLLQQSSDGLPWNFVEACSPEGQLLYF